MESDRRRWSTEEIAAYLARSTRWRRCTRSAVALMLGDDEAAAAVRDDRGSSPTTSRTLPLPPRAAGAT